MRIAAVVVLMGCWGSADPPPAKPAASATSDDSDARAGAIETDPPAGSGSAAPKIGHGSGQGNGVGGGPMHPREIGPNVTIGQGDVSGGLEAAIVRRFLKRYLMKLQFCYERVLAHRPGLTGTVVATFSIGAADGVVTRSDASGVDPDVARCIGDAIKTIAFPTSTAGTDARYPLVLRGL